jgi:protein subunit release factor A
MEGVKVELLYSMTADGKRPTGMVPVGLFPDIVRVTHPTGVVAQVPCDRSQHKAYKAACEMIEWALLECKYLHVTSKTNRQ